MNYDEFIEIARQISPDAVLSTTLPSRKEWDDYGYHKQVKAFESVKVILEIQTTGQG
jgi:hypothetical protein